VEHYLRERKRWTVLEDAPPSLLVSQPIQEEQAASHERRKRFKAALSNLTEGERKLVWLICKEPDEQKIAKRLGATVGAIYQRKHRLIKKIQRLLGK
jgi:RNA polymerase sigma factor (sigma-70 family)